MARADEFGKTTPPCTARVDVGFIAVSITAAVAAVLLLRWWLQ